MKKYVLHPGMIRSRIDGDEHYIRAGDLARLYQVPWGECIIDDGQPGAFYDRTSARLIHLYPSYNGDYHLPEEGKG